MSTASRAAPEPGADAPAKNSHRSPAGTGWPGRSAQLGPNREIKSWGGGEEEEILHLFVPAFEDDGEGSVPDQVLPAELKLSHRLHGAAPGGPRSRRGDRGRDGFRAAKGPGGGGWRWWRSCL